MSLGKCDRPYQERSRCRVRRLLWPDLTAIYLRDYRHRARRSAAGGCRRLFIRDQISGPADEMQEYDCDNIHRVDHQS